MARLKKPRDALQEVLVSGVKLVITKDDSDREVQIAKDLIRELADQTPGRANVTDSTPSDAPLLSTVIAAYKDEKLREGSWLDKTLQENEAIFEMLLRLVGDIPISLVNHATARDYKATLQRLPPNINKSPLYREKSIEQIIAMRPNKLLGVSTLNKHLNRVSTFFAWAVKHGYADSNWFAGLGLKQNTRANQQRLVFRAPL